jgi:hypothetical protein
MFGISWLKQNLAIIKVVLVISGSSLFVTVTLIYGVCYILSILTEQTGAAFVSLLHLLVPDNHFLFVF